MKTESVMKLDDNGHILDADTENLVSAVERSGLQNNLGELEIKLGMARQQGSTDEVRSLEADISEVREQLTPSFEMPGIPYPAPLASEACYGPTGEIIKAIEPHSEADPVALLVNLLTAFGNVIGGGSYFMVGAVKHCLNLFAAFVGDTAKGRKGDSWPPIYKLLELVDPEWAEYRNQTGLSSGEGLIWNVRDPIYKSVLNNETKSMNDVMSDEGVVDKRLLVIEGELAQTLKVLRREGNTLSPVLRNAWDSGKLQTLTKNSPAKATGAHISIIGHITKSELLKALNEIETGNGFANRFLWLCVNRSKTLPFGGDFESIDMDDLTNKLMKALEFGKQAGRLTWGKTTEPLWASVYSEISEGKPGLIGAVTARAEAQVTRLACLYSLFDCSTEIRPAHLRAALSIWGYAEDSARYIFQAITRDPLANKILRALAGRHEGMTRTEINNFLSGSYSTIQITEALNELRGAGLADMRKIRTQGRPVERWFLVNRATEKAE